jgi:hypothetical protein
MSRRYLGCDVGVTGAMAVLDIEDDGSQRVFVVPTPVSWVPVGTGKRRRYDAGALWERLRVHAHKVALCYLEQQSARPGQGVSSTFATGLGMGLWVGLLTAAGIPYVVVPPVRWRARVGLAAQPRAPKKHVKEAVRLAACRRFPAVPIHLEHADAVMMAVAAALEHGAEGNADEARHDRSPEDVRPRAGIGSPPLHGSRDP